MIEWAFGFFGGLAYLSHPKTCDPMTDQQKLYRVFKLIQLLSRPPYRTVPHLANVLEVSKETVYRYIRLLESLGYNIDKRGGDLYFLHIEYKEDKQLIDFEEAAYLQDMLWQIPAGDPRRDRLLHKLNQQYALAPLLQSLSKFQDYEHIRALGVAIESGQRVRLYNYLSGEGALSTRYIEPVEFQNGYTHLWAFDIDKSDYRQFRIARIGSVEVLDEKTAGIHDSRATDLFGWTGPRWLPLTLRLSSRAYQLLLEEYPEARPFLRSDRQHFLFDGMVRDWRGIGRFILGLPGEIEVREPEELKVYLRERAEQGRW